MALITQAEYARLRKSRGLPGGSKPGVLKAVQTGRITLIDGKIDPEIADREWQERTSGAQQRAVGSTDPHQVKVQQIAPAEDGARRVAPAAEGTKAYEEYLLTRAKRIAAEVEGRRAHGELIEVLTVERAWAEIGVKIRDGVMGLPSRVCSRLPEEWRREVALALGAECREILAALRDDIRSVAA